MKVLVYGCGVIGSFLVHTLCKAGNDVTVVSRGNWKDVLETQGLKIHHQLSRQDTVDYPHVTDTVDISERYDVVFSVMQGGVRNQTNVTAVSFGKGSMTVGGLHREMTPRDKKTLETAFHGTGYLGNSGVCGLGGSTLLVGRK